MAGFKTEFRVLSFERGGLFLVAQWLSFKREMAFSEKPCRTLADYVRMVRLCKSWSNS
jgi:hypothetical protein